MTNKGCGWALVLFLSLTWRSAFATEVVVELRSEELAPVALWVAREANAESDDWVMMRRVDGAGARFVVRYRADLPDGTWRFVAARLPRAEGVIDADGLADSPDRGEIAMRGLPETFEVNGAPLRLEGLRVLGYGNLLLLVAEAAMDEDLRRIADTPRRTWHLRALEGGGWALLATGNRLLVRNGAEWHPHRVLEGARPTTFSQLGPSRFLVAGEPAVLSVFDSAQGERRLSARGLPRGSIVAAHCNDAFACVAVLAVDHERVRVYHVVDARDGEWRAVREVPMGDCGWVHSFHCDFTSNWVQLPDRLLIVGRAVGLSVDLATGHVVEIDTPDAPTGGRFHAGRLAVGQHVSDDEGATWTRVGDDGRVGVVQFSTDSTSYMMENKSGFAGARQVLLRVEGQRWKERSVLPGWGAFAASQNDALLYHVGRSGAWFSADGGLSWEPDLALIAALGDGRAAPAGWSRLEASAGEPVPTALLLDEGFDTVTAPQQLALLAQRASPSGRNMNPIVTIGGPGEWDLPRRIEKALAALPEGAIAVAAREGQRRALTASGLESVAETAVTRPTARMFARMPGARGVPHGLVVDKRRVYIYDTPKLLALSPDHEQLWLNLKFEHYALEQSGPRKLGSRVVKVATGPLRAGNPDAALVRWVANDGRLLLDAVRDVFAEGLHLALTASAEPATGWVDVIGPATAERYRGRLLRHVDGRAVIVDPDGALWSVPAVRVL